MKQSTQLVAAGDSIIRISGSTKKTYLGYDIFEEKLIEIEKDRCSNIPDYAIKLLNSQSRRMELALQIKEGVTLQAISLLDVGERTVRRYIMKKDGIGIYRTKGEKIKPKIIVKQIKN